jgi:uncharacterized membrane protein
MKSLMSKKGVVGLDVARSVILMLLGIGVLAFIVIIVMANLSASNVVPAGSLGANQSTAIFANISGGVSTFFGNTGVWFNLLGVVVIVAIAALVLYFVGAFGGKKGL